MNNLTSNSKDRKPLDDNGVMVDRPDGQWGTSFGGVYRYKYINRIG